MLYEPRISAKVNVERITYFHMHRLAPAVELHEYALCQFPALRNVMLTALSAIRRNSLQPNCLGATDDALKCCIQRLALRAKGAVGIR